MIQNHVSAKQTRKKNAEALVDTRVLSFPCDTSMVEVGERERGEGGEGGKIAEN